MSKTIVEPVGGNGGEPFDNYYVPENARLTQLHLFADNFINAIQLVYTTAAGECVTMARIGGLGGEHHLITFESDEYITAIGGRYGWFIDSLYIGTNKNVTPTYGGNSGEHEFHFLAPKGQHIIGFIGRSAWYIDALGVVIRELKGTGG